MVLKDLNPNRDQIRINMHANLIGRVISQEQIAPNLWRVNLDVSLLAGIMGGPKQVTLYFDRKIEWKRRGKTILTTDFQILIRHYVECADPDGVIYCYIVAGTIMEKGVNQPFHAACYSGN